jgi:N-methylhydantoinase A/oxoprolinase/acetone carboxylase beta subunit
VVLLYEDISGGPLAVTDANLILGRLIPEHFPALFGPKGNEALDFEASSVKFKELAETVEWLLLNYLIMKRIYLYRSIHF